ncbi:haloacid dehalogenase superfamily, subfamily IA, variant 3 with third motif having DD or ED [Celeribacter indicus]|nr:HAD family hydrolase [Celeribacter indicus]SDW44013.1 haloacid dehalogenase superfamily, subfamily IA, variant 3 with third motif having DD or ED [Celeribacter indicus]
MDLVIFDCDGVLIDSEVISARMLIAELALHDVRIDTAYVARHFLGRSYPTVLRQIRDEFGIHLPEGFEAAYRARLISAFRSDLVEVAGVRAVIAGLGVPYALATSSSPERLGESLAIVGMADLFAGRCTTASEVANGKPAPDLFLRVAEKYGVAPARCLVIEDSRAGVEAGLAAGMNVWRFTGGSHLAGLDLSLEEGPEPHRVFATYADFFHLAPQLLKGDAHHEQG